jgi:hypothetical protein
MTVGGRVEGTGAMDGGEKKQAQQEERHRNYVTIPKKCVVGGFGEIAKRCAAGKEARGRNRISKKSEDRRIFPLFRSFVDLLNLHTIDQ